MKAPTPTAFMRTPYAAAPAFLFLYGIARLIDGRDGAYGPGAAWTIGHVMFLCGLLTFGLVIMKLYQQIGRDTTKHRFIVGLAATLGLMGLAIFVRVAVIDIITGLSAANHADMGAISSKLNAYPNASLEPYYKLGPLLFQLGILTLMVQLATIHRLPWWSPVLLFAGFLLLGVNLNLLMPGALLIGCALLPFAIQPRRTFK